MQRSNFEGKFLSKLSKIDRQEIESFLGRLVREKNFLEVIFNALLDGIVVLSPSLEVLYTNNAAVEMLGLDTRRRIAGERINDLCQDSAFGSLVARFAIRRKRAFTEEIIIPAGDAPRTIAISLIPLEADEGNTEGSAVMILRDVTRERRHEEERRRAERAMTIARLAAGLAHEIKNPLNSMQIHAQLVQRGLDDKRRRKMNKERLTHSAGIIVEEIQRLSGVVNDFLQAVRPTRPMLKKGDINTVAEHAAAIMRPEAETRGVSVRLHLDHELPAAEFDPDQITQALINLIKNALEALEGRPDPLIELRTSLADSGFLVSVGDNGKGIPENERGKIFEPYYTTKFSGTGLGLAIVSRVVEEHGGQLDLYSNPGEGTVVTMAFPLDSRPVRLIGSNQDK